MGMIGTIVEVEVGDQLQEMIVGTIVEMIGSVVVVIVLNAGMIAVVIVLIVEMIVVIVHQEMVHQEMVHRGMVHQGMIHQSNDPEVIKNRKMTVGVQLLSVNKCLI